jgi:large subunit ribosomal protein L25
MSDQIVLHAKKREEQGKGASRRLRKEGQVPTIIYGAGKEPKMISLDHNKLLRYEMDDSFFSSILKVEIDGGDEENVIIRDYQRDPVKPKILHVDLLRIKMSEKMHTSTPLNFIGDENSVGVKAGGVLQRLVNEVDIACMPGDLPESIDVDVSALDIGDSIHLSQLVMPEGVELLAMIQMDEADDEHKSELDLGVVSIQAPRAVTTDSEESEEGADAPSEGDADSDGDATE